MTLSMRGLVFLATLAVVGVALAGTAFAKQDDNTRPGWGFGDKNHVHTGPPGQTVHPVK